MWLVRPKRGVQLLRQKYTNNGLMKYRGFSSEDKNGTNHSIAVDDWFS